jgi:hypothetical protein
LFFLSFLLIFYFSTYKRQGIKVRVSDKNTTAGSSHISERGLIERRTCDQEMNVNTMEGEINDVAGEEVVMKDMDYAKVKNKVIKSKTKVAGETA